MSNTVFPVDKATVKMVAWLSIASFPLCLLAIFFMLAAVDYDADLLALPVAVMPVLQGDYLHAFGISDMLGYYLLRIPMIIFLWQWLRPHNPALADIAGVCGLLFVVMAVMASSLLVGGTTALAGEYRVIDESARAGLEPAWTALVLSVNYGPWHFMMLPWLVWCAVTGRLLTLEMRWLGWGLQLLALTALVALIEPILSWAWLSGLAGLQTLMMPLWILLMGVALLRGFHLRDARKAKA